MSTLWSGLRKPTTYLFVLCVLLLLGMLDSFKQPKSQITARLYEGAVGVYQHYVRPLSSRYIRCRYRPTCSEYSLEAVHRYGIRYGLVLTVKRLASCTLAVPLGTQAPFEQRPLRNHQEDL
jgi:uncharacterized protein